MGLQTGTCWQIATYFCHVDKYENALNDQGHDLLAAHKACMSFISYSYQQKIKDSEIKHYVGIWHHRVGKPNDFQESLGIEWF